MKITKNTLRKLIKEEMSLVREEEGAQLDTLFKDVMEKSKALAGQISTATNSKTKRINFAKSFLSSVMKINLDKEESLNRALITALNKQSGEGAKAVDIRKQSSAPPEAASDTDAQLAAIAKGN